jgi:hypothetical protein
MNETESQEIEIEIESQTFLKDYEKNQSNNSHFCNFINIITFIPRLFFSIILEIVLVPLAILFVLFACLGVSFNYDPEPENLKKSTPILLIHGNGFNEIEW